MIEGEYKAMGRRPKLTKEMIDKAHKLIKQGNYVNVAITYLGITEGTYYNWVNKGERDEKAIEEWLKHNEITICEAEAKTDPDEITYIYKAGSRGRKKKES